MSVETNKQMGYGFCQPKNRNKHAILNVDADGKFHYTNEAGLLVWLWLSCVFIFLRQNGECFIQEWQQAIALAVLMVQSPSQLHARFEITFYFWIAVFELEKKKIYIYKSF